MTCFSERVAQRGYDQTAHRPGVPKARFCLCGVDVHIDRIRGQIQEAWMELNRAESLLSKNSDALMSVQAAGWRAAGWLVGNSF